jgi:hypothetical protein
MARLGITEAFAQYKATLRNPQWSVSAWAPEGSLVVSLWDHHFRKSPPGTMEFAGSLDRWSGHGNREFRENVAKAYAAKSRVRLVIVRTDEIERVEAGEDASKVRKEFYLREEVTGEVVELDGDRYVFRFTK